MSAITMLVFDKLISGLAVSPVCPRCKGEIPGEDINVAKDVAYCRHCNLALRFSLLTDRANQNDEVDLNQPPPGTCFRREADGLLLSVNNRSPGGALGLLFFSLLWNGIVSVFVLLTLSATMHRLGISLPSWFPAFAAKSGSLPWPMITFLWLFLVPFIAIGLLVLGCFLNCVGGRVEIRLQNGHGILFRGIGPIGFRKSFEASEVRDVRMEDRRWRDGDGDPRHNFQIIIETAKGSLQFGSMFTEQRRRFVVGALRKELVRQ
jgi:hypothetical protein